MSFSSTPLGQGKRLDHHTFLRKATSNNQRTANSLSLPPTSYSHGALLSGSKATSPNPEPTHDNEDDTALAQFARIKQREQLANRPGGPKIITSPPKPDKWAVKDTSVNIASAFHQAADMSNPNNSWASGSTRPQIAPRSTSVEYESQVQATTTSRRLAAPPSKSLSSISSRTTIPRKPLSKASSVRHVPDSEGEEDRPAANGRGKSPLQPMIESARRIGATASFYLQQKLAEPGEASKEKESSYEYDAEEREYQNSQSTARRANNAANKRGRISMDNKAYKPSQSDEETSDEDVEGEGKTRRRKKKPLLNGLSLPIIAGDKRRKRRTKGNKANIEEEGEEGEHTGSEDESTEQQSVSYQRASIPRNSEPPQRQPSVARGSVPRELPSINPDESIDAEQGLDSIPEVDEDQLDIHPEPERHRRRSVSRPPTALGGTLGTLVNFATRQVLRAGLFVVSVFFFIGTLFGTLFDLMLRRPWGWFTGGAPIGKYIVLGLILSSAYWLRDPLLQYVPVPRGSSHASLPVYHAPDVPAANIAELASRLQRIENALSGLSLDAEKGRLRAEHEAREQLELMSRLGALEGKVSVETRRAAEAEAQARNAAKEGLGVIKQEVEILQAQIQAAQQQHQAPPPNREHVSTNDAEARAKVKALEERLGSVEGGVKEALELGRKATSSNTGVVSTGPSAAWWNKLASGGAAKSGLTIKSSDGQDVTSLIEHLVDSAVSTHSKDTLARPDFALHSGGARVIPSLTSPTFEIRPTNLRGQLLEFITGNGRAIGRPPVWALHHEQQNGHCWPVAGSTGQLGVALAAPTYISDISIDHVAKEVAFDMRSAPREMEVWGMVEGKDNVAKVRDWITEKAKRREEALENGEEVEEEPEYPKTLPRVPQYVRIANFSYDIHAARNVQTFPVDKEVKALGVDFGIVVLMIKSNWGREEYTCLYRLRVHGEKMGETPLPYPEVA